MNQRELSERLEELANRIEELSGSYELSDIAAELRKLSSENYVPGNSLSWKDVKPKTNSSYTDKKTGRNLPF